jgi:hypothetical protein
MCKCVNSGCTESTLSILEQKIATLESKIKKLEQAIYDICTALDQDLGSRSDYTYIHILDKFYENNHKLKNS